MENKNEIINEVEQVAPIKAKKGRKPKNPFWKPVEAARSTERRRPRRVASI